MKINSPVSAFLFEFGVHILTTAWKIFLLPSQRSDKNDGVIFPIDSEKETIIKVYSIKTISISIINDTSERLIKTIIDTVS